MHEFELSLFNCFKPIIEHTLNIKPKPKPKPKKKKKKKNKEMEKQT